MFEAPTFELWSVIYTAVGAVVIWSKLGQEKRKVYVLSDVLDRFSFPDKIRIGIELTIFVSLGCLVSGGIVHPTNAAQAIAAGMGWTGMLSTKREEQAG